MSKNHILMDKKTFRELESAIVVCLLQNGYEAREANKVTDLLIEYFRKEVV